MYKRQVFHSTLANMFSAPHFNVFPFLEVLEDIQITTYVDTYTKAIRKTLNLKVVMRQQVFNNIKSEFETKKPLS